MIGECHLLQLGYHSQLATYRFATKSGKESDIPVLAQTIGLLVLSNVFMTFAWYAHLKNLNNKPWLLAALASWGIAFF